VGKGGDERIKTTEYKKKTKIREEEEKRKINIVRYQYCMKYSDWGTTTRPARGRRKQCERMEEPSIRRKIISGSFGHGAQVNRRRSFQKTKKGTRRGKRRTGEENLVQRKVVKP